MDEIKSKIITDRLIIELAGMADLDELEVMEKECECYFTFDPPNENNHSCSVKECLIEGDLPPNGIKENYYFFKICHNFSIIGFFAYYLGYPDNKDAYISVLYISEKYRRNGFGSEAVNCIIGHLESLGMKEIRLHVSLRNTTGLLFWVKKGFDRITKVECNGNLLPGTFAGIELQYICRLL